MTSNLFLENEPKTFRGMTQLAELRLMQALFPEASLLKLDFQQGHPELHSAIAALLIAVFDADLTTTELLLSFNTDTGRYNLHIEIDPAEKERIIHSAQDEAALVEQWQEFSNGLQELLLAAGSKYIPIELKQNSPNDFSWDLQFDFDPRKTDTSVVGLAGISLAEYVAMAMAAGVTVDMTELVGQAAATKAAELASSNIRKGELSAIAQDTLGLPECRVAFATVSSTELSTTSPFNLRVMVYNIYDGTYTEAQYEELITRLKQYFKGVLGMEFSLAPFSAGIANKKTHKRGKNKGKISGGLIDLTFICGVSDELGK